MSNHSKSLYVVVFVCINCGHYNPPDNIVASTGHSVAALRLIFGECQFELHADLGKQRKGESYIRWLSHQTGNVMESLEDDLTKFQK